MWLERQVNDPVDTLKQVPVLRSIRVDEICKLDPFNPVSVPVSIRNIGQRQVEIVSQHRQHQRRYVPARPGHQYFSLCHLRVLLTPFTGLNTG